MLFLSFTSLIKSAKYYQLLHRLALRRNQFIYIHILLHCIPVPVVAQNSVPEVYDFPHKSELNAEDSVPRWFVKYNYILAAGSSLTFP